MERVPVTVRESPAFARWADAVWATDERAAFIDFIARNPMAGAVIPGSGGFRKVRWNAKGHGKRGGARIITYFLDVACPLYLALGYAKGEAENLSEKQKSTLREIAKAIKAEARSRQV